MVFTLVIPDLHGCFVQFINILNHFKIITNIENMTIKDIFKISFYNDNLFKKYFDFSKYNIIQLGDILDSKNRIDYPEDLVPYSDMILFYFINRLKEVYKDSVILLLGNHELLNYIGVYDYTNNKSRDDKNPNKRKKNHEIFINKKLENNFIFYFIYKKNLFIHANISPKIKDYYSLKYIDKNILKEKLKIDYNELFSRELIKTETLDNYNLNRIIIGHTPHINIMVYDERIFYLDVFISRCFGNQNKIYSLMIINDNNDVFFEDIDKTCCELLKTMMLTPYNVLNDYDVNFLLDII